MLCISVGLPGDKPGRQLDMEGHVKDAAHMLCEKPSLLEC